MTVPGKGGRPRKWRSDADRLRAYRARQAGRDEPPKLVQALGDGDELAVALEQINALQVELAAAATVQRALRLNIRSLRREIAARDARFGWLERANVAHCAAQQTAERERDALVREVADLRVRLRVAVVETRLPATPRPPAPPILSRVERRSRERDQRRPGE